MNELFILNCSMIKHTILFVNVEILSVYQIIFFCILTVLQTIKLYITTSLTNHIALYIHIWGSMKDVERAFQMYTPSNFGHWHSFIRKLWSGHTGILNTVTICIGWYDPVCLYSSCITSMCPVSYFGLHPG